MESKAILRRFSFLTSLLLAGVVGFFLLETGSEGNFRGSSGEGGKPPARPAANETASSAETVESSSAMDTGASKREGKPSRLWADLYERVYLTETEIQSYLNQHPDNPEVWMAAALLRQVKVSFAEEAGRFPKNPAIQAAHAISAESGYERRQAIEQLRRIDPDNALGDYLSALDYLKEGRNAEALEDLGRASTKFEADEFSLEQMEAIEDALLASGYQDLDAKISAMLSLAKPMAHQMHDLNRRLKSLESSSGGALTLTIRESALHLGRNLQGSKSLMDPTVGMSIELPFLDTLQDKSCIEQIQRDRLAFNPKLDF